MRIWIDIDNSPHVQVMEPLIKELQNKGHKIFITARDYGHTVELLDMKNIKYSVIGSHPGRSISLKILFLFSRMIKLYIWAFDKRIDLALSHGSRSMILPSRFLGIPFITMYDYEYISDFLFKIFAKKILMPELSADINNKKYISFPGLKEEIYLWQHKYQNNWNKDIHFDKENVIVILRPPATMAHYHNPRAETIFVEILKHINSISNIKCILIPRTEKQRNNLEKFMPETDKILIPPKALDGLSMLKDADMIIGGGGTMNREASLLGIPVYSIFQSRIGKIDRWLEKCGRMNFIETEEDIKKITFKKKSKTKPLVNCNNSVSYLCNIIESVYRE